MLMSMLTFELMSASTLTSMCMSMSRFMSTPRF